MTGENARDRWSQVVCSPFDQEHDSASLNVPEQLANRRSSLRRCIRSRSLESSIYANKTEIHVTFSTASSHEESVEKLMLCSRAQSPSNMQRDSEARLRVENVSLSKNCVCSFDDEPDGANPFHRKIRAPEAYHSKHAVTVKAKRSCSPPASVLLATSVHMDNNHLRAVAVSEADLKAGRCGPAALQGRGVQDVDRRRDPRRVRFSLPLSSPPSLQARPMPAFRKPVPGHDRSTTPARAVPRDSKRCAEVAGGGMSLPRTAVRVASALAQSMRCLSLAGVD